VRWIFFFDITRDTPLAVSFSVGRNGGPKKLVIDSQKSQKSGQQIQQFAGTAKHPFNIQRF
jgi:hypothetical protein